MRPEWSGSIGKCWSRSWIRRKIRMRRIHRTWWQTIWHGAIHGIEMWTLRRRWPSLQEEFINRGQSSWELELATHVGVGIIGSRHWHRHRYNAWRSRATAAAAPTAATAATSIRLCSECCGGFIAVAAVTAFVAPGPATSMATIAFRRIWARSGTSWPSSGWCGWACYRCFPKSQIAHSITFPCLIRKVWHLLFLLLLGTRAPPRI